MQTGLAFAGAVLTGGASRRMGPGVDKALLAVGGVPLAVRLAGVLTAAGAARVVAIGGDGPRLRALGLDWRPDRDPGEGPLGGLLTALAESPEPVTVVVATDLPELTPAVVGALVAALGADDATDVALARTDRLEPLCGAWRRRARPALERAYAAGERAVHAALAELVRAEVAAPLAALRNVNRPGDL